MDDIERRLEVAERKLERIKGIVQEWYDKQGHDQCHYYPELFRELAPIVEVKIIDPHLPPRAEFKRGCKMFQDEIYRK